MPEIKHAFNAGRMNKDLDERLVPQGEYIEANNVQIVAPEEGAIGVIRNIKGNTKIPSTVIPEANTIAHVVDYALNKIYWIVQSSSLNAILAYDGNNDEIYPILIDTNDVLSLNGETETVTINGINIINSKYIAWSPSNSEPRIIDIDLFSEANGTSNYSVHTKIYGRDFVEDDTTVIRHNPLNAPNVVEKYRDDELQKVLTANLSTYKEGDTFTVRPTIIDPVTLELGQYVFVNGVVNVYVECISSVSIIIPGEPATLFIEHTFIVIKRPDYLQNADLSWNLYTVSEKIFELDFVRFAYRWKFYNGQYSLLSPFSNFAFLPSDYGYDSQNLYNKGMENRMQEVVLNFIEVTYNNIYKTQNFIESVEIIIKKDGDNNIYLLDTVSKADLIANVVNGTNHRFNVLKETIHATLASGVILNHWSAVPLRATTQEFLANRILYGNFELGIDTKNIKPEFNIGITKYSDTVPSKSLKTGRKYKLGVVYQDKYGRQTPVISNNNAEISLPFNSSYYLTGHTRINVFLSDDISSLPSEITHYRYYIKDVAGKYENIMVREIFPDPSERDGDKAVGDIWAAIDSSEINKIKNGDFLIIKKLHNQNEPLGDKSVKIKVLDISESAPNFIGKSPGYTDDDNLNTVYSPTNTSFNYKYYDASGKFFVKLQDKNNVLFNNLTASGGAGGFYIVKDGDLRDYRAATYEGTLLARVHQYSTENNGTLAYLKLDFYYLNGLIYITIHEPITLDYNSGNNYDDYIEHFTTAYSNSTFSCGDNTIITATGNWKTIFISNDFDGRDRTLLLNWDILEDWDFNTGPPIATAAKALLNVYSCPADSSAVINPTIFETEAKEENLDIYYETQNTYPISEYNNTKTIEWSNCINFLNGVESISIRDDYNEKSISKGVRVSTVLNTDFKKSLYPNRIIWSGLYNELNDYNGLNEFLTSNPITKDINPEYGSIQKLLTRNSDVVAFCEDKVIKILANKDALYNADGSTNITASNAVLGQAVPFAGEFGISKNPESLANYGYRSYFTDKERGVILRLSMDGLEVISDDGMSSWFRNKFRSHTGAINGAYDIYTNQYVVSFQHDKAVSYSEYTKGWTSFHDYTFEAGLSLNGEFYTFKNAELWKHNSADVYSNIYSDQKTASVKFVFNSEASVVKNFKTLSYEGSQGWEVDDITTDLQTGQILSFVGKEGKYFDYISGKDVLDLSNFSVQGLGVVQTNVITD